MEPSVQFDEIQERLAALGKNPLPDKNFALSRPRDLLFLWGILLPLKVPEQPEMKEIRDRALDEHMDNLQPPAKSSIADDADLYQFPGYHAVMKAWSQPFVGSTIFEDFKSAVQRYATTEDWNNALYARVIPFIQSSGVGKSRMLDEAAKQFFTFPMCLRPPGGNRFPPGDASLVDLLCHIAADRNNWGHLLREVLSCATETVTASPSLANPEHWRTHLYGERGTRRPRRDFYERVTSAAKSRTGSDLADLQKAFGDLSERLEGRIVLFYIDEAQELTAQAMKDLMITMGPLSDMRNHVLVLASTKPQLSHLAPTLGNPGNVASKRYEAFDPSSQLIQPWTSFPFKIFNIAPPLGEEWTPNYARTFRLSASIGRPLWGSELLEETGSSLKAAEWRIMCLAYEKLTLTTHDKEVPSSDALEAALVCRLCPGIERNCAAIGFATDLVENRMATALFVEPSRQWMASCFPVDPVLGWAAFQMIAVCEWGQAGKTQHALYSLWRLSQSGLIERGVRGELFTKYVLMRAYDQAVRAEWKRVAPTVEVELRPRMITPFLPVTLTDFMTHLSGDEGVMDVTSIEGTKPLKGLAGCSLALVQWIGCHGSQSTIDVNLALQGLLTHTGIQMPFNMPGIDHLLPACRDASKPISVENLIDIMTQSMNRKQARAVPMPRTIINRFAQRGVPVIYIQHEVAPFGGANGMRKDDTQAPWTIRAAKRMREEEEEEYKEVQYSDVWCFTMDGAPEELLGGHQHQRAASGLVESQTDPFFGHGNVSTENILPMLSMLCNEKSTRGHVWQEASGLFA